MAYSTGTLNSAVDFPSIFDTFLLANGWTKVANSTTVSLVSTTYSGTSTSSSMQCTSSGGLNGVPLGSKVTFTGSGTSNIYFFSKSNNLVSGSLYSDTSWVSTGSVTATFSWNTYNKGTKYINFSGGIHNYTNSGSQVIHYILLDLYHSGTGNHNQYQQAQACRFNAGTSDIPCTYYIFGSGTPDNITVMFTFGVKAQWFTLGDLSKVHNSAYVGGEYLVGSSFVSPGSAGVVIGGLTLQETLVTAGGATSAGPFPFPTGLGNGAVVCDGLAHAEIDGYTYTMNGNTTRITVTQNCLRKLWRGLNNWNQQTLLVPIELQHIALSSFYMYLGYLEHIRLIRIDNYNVNDSITLGSDTWRVFPVAAKDAVLRNPTGTSTGTVGLAIRYVP